MTPLSKLASSDLHALVSELDAKPIHGRSLLASILALHSDEQAGCSRKHLDELLSRLAQSRDLVPELDRRLRVAEAKLSQIREEALSPVAVSYEYDPTPTSEERLTRIAALTQP